MAVQGRYNSWYISLPSSAKQQLEMTKFCVQRDKLSGGRDRQRLIF